MAEPRWLTIARARIGTRETPGPASTPRILEWARRVGGKRLGIDYGDDAVPWCGLFMADVMVEAGLVPPPVAVRASSWELWGARLLRPSLGAILTFNRTGGGHVGLYAGEDAACFHVLGGNQGDAVSIARIAKARMSAIRWPPGEPIPRPGTVVLGGDGRVSTDEA